MPSVSPTNVPYLPNLEASPLFQRLKSLDTKASFLIEEVAKQADTISGWIVRHMPQYTNHSTRHLQNVLSLAESLIPNETREKLTSIECVLILLGVYTHDLGMALPDDEFKQITGQEGEDHPIYHAYQTHREGYAEEVRQIELLQKRAAVGDVARADGLEQHIRAEWLRKTHAEQGGRRIGVWLDRIANGNPDFYKIANYDIRDWALKVAVSHNMSAAWLRESLTHGRSETSFRAGESNLAFPGLVLRLADYIDFDATRAPEILFRNIGIENKISVAEWNKHLQITWWGWREEKVKFVYEAKQCESPIYHKTILEFVAGIGEEVRRVRDELQIQRDRLRSDGAHYVLTLPEKVEAEIEAKLEDGKPAYIYRDIQFKLDQDEILQLLMGESLYGDPSLCIRELLQNALDAVDLRVLRLEMKAKGETPAEPTDPFEAGEEPHVRVTWGEENGVEYIRVIDNGVGMTQKVLETYFTQIGKSFYRSSEFESEKRRLRANGILSTPISQFGIGILSCFMLADRLEVRTCPGHKNDSDRKPYDVTISGPGSLFWMKSGTKQEQGTEVTLWMKEIFQIAYPLPTIPTKIKSEHNKSKNSTIESDDKPFSQNINPVLIAAHSIIWPKYRLFIGDSYVIDTDSFNEIDFNLHKNTFLSVCKDLHYSDLSINDISWKIIDWTDCHGELATGTRIRLFLPTENPATGKKIAIQDLFTIIQQSNRPFCYPFITNRSIRINDSAIKHDFPLSTSGGIRLLIDLRGSASPPITSNRNDFVRSYSKNDWVHLINQVVQKWLKHLYSTLTDHDDICMLNSSVFHEIEDIESPGIDSGTFRLLSKEVSNEQNQLEFNRKMYRYECALNEGRTNDYGWHMDYELSTVLTKGITTYRGFKSQNNDLRYLMRIAAKLANFLPEEYQKNSEFQYLDPILPKMNSKHKQFIAPHLRMNLFNEALNPDLPDSFGLLNLRHLKGKAGNGHLISPTEIDFRNNSEKAIRSPSDSRDRHYKLNKYKYDLCFPFSIVPLDEFKDKCPNWIDYRFVRAVSVLPFINFRIVPEWKKTSIFFSEEFLKTDYIHVILPDFSLWSKLFTEWTDSDLSVQCWSATWETATGNVVWAKGAYTPEEMIGKVGKPFEEFCRLP